MREMPSIQLVKTWYVTSFHEIRNAPTPNTVAKEADFAVLLKNIYERHAPVLLTMARGAYELRQKYVAGSSEFYDLEVHNFLDAFYLSRIGIRMLIGQYLGKEEKDKRVSLGICLIHIRSLSYTHRAARAPQSRLYWPLLSTNVSPRCRTDRHRRRQVHVHAPARGRP